jgi:succinylglutamic semialdehyde dehydrogenase
VDDSKDRLLRKGDYVYGSFLKPEAIDGYINGVNPGDRSDVLGRFSFSESSVDEAVDFAAIGARAWRRVSINDRAAAVRRFRDHMARYQERLARMITRETGKPIWEARQEVLASIRSLDLFLDEGVNILSPRVIEEIGARSDRLPRGVVGILCPYNFPVLIPATQSAAALLAGDSVVVKPSKFTPGVGQSIAELWDRCKLPRGVYNMVQGPGAVVGQRIALHPGVDVLSFTGSYSTAAAIRQITIGRHEMPVVMQTGGKGIAIVLDDAELDRAVYEVLVGAYLTAGQRHNSTGRVIVTEGIYDRFVAKLKAQAEALDVGYGFRNDVFVGPLISENLRARYKRFGRQLSAREHEPIIEAAPVRTPRRGFYARPAMYRVHWENGHPFLGDEPPGPMLLIYKVSTWREAAALHNQAVFRLATSVFTRVDSPVLSEMRDRLRTGALNINRGTIGASLRLPSVGLGRSSNGLSSGLELLYTLTHPRSQLVESRPFVGMPVLPGIHWEASPPSESEVEVEVEDTEEDDLSSSLELALD